VIWLCDDEKFWAKILLLIIVGGTAHLARVITDVNRSFDDARFSWRLEQAQLLNATPVFTVGRSWGSANYDWYAWGDVHPYFFGDDTAGAQNLAMQAISRWLSRGIVSQGNSGIVVGPHPCRRESDGTWWCDFLSPEPGRGEVRGLILWNEFGNTELQVSGFQRQYQLDGTCRKIDGKVRVTLQPSLLR